VSDTGRNVGPGTNDTLVLVFDQAVRQVGVGTFEQLPALVALQPAFPAWVSLRGAWTSPFALTVSVTVAGGVLANWTAWNPGSLTVSIRAAANLTSANGESGASNSSVTVGGGSWGDAPSVFVTPKNATAVTVTLVAPAVPLAYSVDTYVVQWSTVASFAGAAAVPSSMAAVVGWTTSGTVVVPALDDGNRAVASVTLVSTGGPGSALDAAVVRVTAPPLRSPLRFDVPHLSTSTAYYFRGACNGPAGQVGPVVASDPASATPQPPLIASIVAPSSTNLPTSGGMVLEATGEQLGAADSTVVMVLTSAEFGEFRSPPCVVVAPGSRVRCLSPAGVGTGLAAAVSVDGVLSPPYSGSTLAYAPPAITGLRAVAGSSPGGADGGVSTSGGGVVVVEGVNFGPAALGDISLGVVSYSPRGLSVLHGTPVSFPGLDCVISRNHSEVTCGMGPGVGSGLQWSVTIAGQTASTATTTYHPPVITALGVGSGNGSVSWTAAALAALDTAGGQRLVRPLHDLPFAHSHTHQPLRTPIPASLLAHTALLAGVC
jgi:hypothetical protein